MVTAPQLRVSFVAAILLCIGAGTASAEDVSTAEFAELVDRAVAADTGGLVEVSSVDSIPVDINDLILSGSLDEREIRLETLRRVLSDSSATDLDSSVLRSDAREIISNPPYSASASGGDSWLERVVEFLATILGNSAVPGIAILVVIVIALVIAIPVLNGVTGRRQAEGKPTLEPSQRVDFGAAATEAEERGDHRAAVRLLFLDGAKHLEANKVVANAATTSTTTVRRISEETEFLDRFDEIAYGGSDAQSTDVSQARTAWQRLKDRTWGR